MNTQVVNETRDALKLTTNERIPNPIPVIEVNPKLVKNLKVLSGVATNATSSTLLTTPVNQDIYICGAQLSIIKDVTSTSTYSSIRFTDETEAVIALVAIPSLTLTAQTQSVAVTLTKPIKCKRGTTITITNTTNVANISAYAQVYYYADEYSNA